MEKIDSIRYKSLIPEVIKFDNSDLDGSFTLTIPFYFINKFPNLTIYDNNGLRWLEANMSVQFVNNAIKVTFPQAITGTWTYQLEKY